MHRRGRGGFWRRWWKGLRRLRGLKVLSAEQVKQVALFLLHVTGNDTGTTGGRRGVWGFQRRCRRRRRYEFFLQEHRERNRDDAHARPAQDRQWRQFGPTFTGVGGLTSLSLARASFLGSLLFSTNRPGDLWDRITSQILTVSLKEEKRMLLIHQLSKSPPRTSWNLVTWTGCLQLEKQTKPNIRFL